MDGKKDDKNSVDELIKDYNAILRERALYSRQSQGSSSVFYSTQR